MRSKLHILVVSLWVIAFGQAQTTPEAMVEKMGRGINLGNTLSAPFEGNWAPAVQETYFEDIANAGFTNVRIPIRFDKQTTSLSDVDYTDINGNYTGSVSDYSVNTSYLDRIEEVTTWALDQNLVAIIDVHGDHWYWESYDSESDYYKTGADRLAAEDRFKAIWIAISTRFKNAPDNLLFEIMNEAYFSMSAEEVNAVNANILETIRATNPTRNIIVTGGGANSWQAPLQMDPQLIENDDYLIATFHYYRPFKFTSSSKKQYSQFEWGSEADKAAVESNFDAVKSWSQTYNIPVYLGEFGADNENGYNYSTETYGNYGGPTNASRVEYHRFLAEAAIARDFSFAAWDAGHKSNKTIYIASDRSWVDDVRKALLPNACLDASFIINADIECGVNQSWNLFTAGTSTASVDEATFENSKQGNTIMVEVTSSEGAFNNVILRNMVINAANLSGQAITISGFAKSSSNSQQIKYRMKSVVNGSAQLTASQAFDLKTDDFEQFNFIYTVPPNTETLQFQVLLGKQTGTYFFDDFSVEQQTLGMSDARVTSVKLIPNPASSTISIQSPQSISSVQIYDANGKLFKVQGDQSIDISSLANGMYFLKIAIESNKITYKKLLINH